LNLAGLTKNPKNEGYDITPLLKNPAKKWDIPSITTLGQNEHSIRTLQYRYIVYNDGAEELYDHFVDPLEWINLAKNPRFAKLKDSLRKYIPKVNVPSIGSSSKSKGGNENRNQSPERHFSNAIRGIFLKSPSEFLCDQSTYILTC
jgi:hypothetical protein